MENYEYKYGKTILRRLLGLWKLDFRKAHRNVLPYRFYDIKSFRKTFVYTTYKSVSPVSY